MRLKDTATGYGWISILLHWITAIVIVYLLYLGSSIGSLLGVDRTRAIDRHTSVAIASYLLLFARVVWRFVYPHPGPTNEQRSFAFTMGKWTHYAIVVAVALMLVTGPLMHFSYGHDIVVFDWFVIPSPIETSFDLAGVLYRIHSASALFIFIAVLLHIGGVYKHTAFKQDGTLAKIIIPGRQSSKRGAIVPPIDESGEP